MLFVYIYIDCTYVSSDLSLIIMLQCQRGTIVEDYRTLYSVAVINYRRLQRENRPNENVKMKKKIFLFSTEKQN